MSTPADPTTPASADPASDPIAAALPPGMTLQNAALRLANGVCQAYAAYNNGSNQMPQLQGYQGINQIFVYEVDPNGNPFSTVATQARAAAATEVSKVERQPAAYARGADGAPPACVGKTPVGTPSIGSQLFGFTATANDRSHNLLALRGTVTLEEAGYDLLGWGTNKPCRLPTQSTRKQTYGMVNSDLFSFYSDAGTFGEDSLAASCMKAIRATSAQAPNLPWILGGHSLGGAMISLAALDAVVSNAFGTIQPTVITFGSLHVGDGAFAKAYTPKVPGSWRIANLCDFVPSMVSLEPVTPTDPYVHVGTEATFVWQTWDDWGNHSLASIYMPVVQNYWNVIKMGPRKYPQ